MTPASRRDFIPDRIWHAEPGEPLTPLDRADRPGLWERVAASDEAVVTQVSVDPHGMVWPTSSSSAPYLMREMLDALGPVAGRSVLEIGTGTGYNAALMAEAGADVTTVEIDPDLASAASAALERAGFADRVRVLVADGEAGAPDHAPFDRVIATAAAHTVPYAWVAQTREGGRIVVPFTGAECPGALLVLDVADGIAAGGAVGDAFFMPLRAQKQPQAVLQAERAPGALESLRVTVDPSGQTVHIQPCG
ncbi:MULTISPECIES: protein-L-isoaspartate O-methyltransferase family protein [Thermomonosporaceae]|uniref:protein-L-isoaspartate O-methyltransferase family protein n=1 Tax=Thermomonosporaceae TaxID=2012 RepID=UPI00255AA15E|nr:MULTISPECIES: methyltransferase domain-containing protein [Thermomonosporaceae]MDL4773050.1 methyltransferase domain-containing protein [Actinomadura xylanilytica]